MKQKKFATGESRETAYWRRRSQILLSVSCLFGAALLVDLFRSSTKIVHVSVQRAIIPVQVPEAPPTDPKVKVLYAKSGIAPGTPLAPDLFEEREQLAEIVPASLVKVSELTSLSGKIIGGYVDANTPLYRDQIKAPQVASPFQIPPGFRAVSILVDSRISVEGFARPGALVDVMLTYKDQNNEQRIATVARMIKVLSIQGGTERELRMPSYGSFPMTLLANERDAKAIQLAASSGLLTLTLVGDEEEYPAAPTIESESLDDLLVASYVVPEVCKPDVPLAEVPAEARAALSYPDLDSVDEALLSNGRPDSERFLVAAGQTE